VRSNPLCDDSIDDTGLDHYARIWNIHFEDVIQARKADYYSAFDGEGTPAKSSAGAAGDEGDMLARAQSDHSLYLFSRGRQHHGKGNYAEICQAIALIGAELLARGDQSLADH
jgi:hypothetical protein